MIKGIIFDLDGTLLNTLADITCAVNMTMNYLSYPTFTKEEVRKKIGNGFNVLIEKCVPQKVSADRIDEIVNIFIDNYAKVYKNESCPYTGIKELLDCLQSKNILIGVNSNKKDEYTKKLVDINFKNIDLSLVYGSRANVNKKPDPITNYDILHTMNLNKNEVLYVGDSLVDLKTGINTGLKTIIVSWGFEDKDVLCKNNIEYLIDDPLEIIEIIDSLNK